MANKNHALDGAIVSAAMEEFLADGFEKASMRKIAAAAHVTVGAIYTRYPTKDALFCSLVRPLLEGIGAAFSDLRAEYRGQEERPGPEHLAASMQRESETILHLLFDDYDRAVLLLCRSAGSSLEHFFDEVVEMKCRETVAFFEDSGLPHPAPGVLRLLTEAQFHMYFRIVASGCGLEEARDMMNAAVIYHTGGWLTLLGLRPTES